MTTESQESPPRVPSEAPKQHEEPRVVFLFFFSGVASRSFPRANRTGSREIRRLRARELQKQTTRWSRRKAGANDITAGSPEPQTPSLPGPTQQQPSARVCVCVFLRPDCSPSSGPLLFRESVGNRAAVCDPPSVRREELFSRCLPRWRRGTGGRQRETRRASGTFSA